MQTQWLIIRLVHGRSETADNANNANNANNEDRVTKSGQVRYFLIKLAYTKEVEYKGEEKTDKVDGCIW